jgi:hypothetical protein
MLWHGSPTQARRAANARSAEVLNLGYGPYGFTVSFRGGARLWVLWDGCSGVRREFFMPGLSDRAVSEMGPSCELFWAVDAAFPLQCNYNFGDIGHDIHHSFYQ